MTEDKRLLKTTSLMLKLNEYKHLKQVPKIFEALADDTFVGLIKENKDGYRVGLMYNVDKWVKMYIDDKKDDKDPDKAFTEDITRKEAFEMLAEAADLIESNSVFEGMFFRHMMKELLSFEE